MDGLVFSTGPSFAKCGWLVYSAKGKNQKRALTKANNKGLVEVRRLNAKYGKRIKYQKASFKCKFGSKVYCTIQQKYCIKGHKNKKFYGGSGCGYGKIFLEGKCIPKNQAASYCGPGYRVYGTKCVHQNNIPQKCPTGQVWNKQEGCHYDD